MRKYTFSVEIFEGSDEFWEELRTTGSSGADDITSMVKEALAIHGFDVYGPDAKVTLTKYEDS
jgi:hypothetical protein